MKLDIGVKVVHPEHGMITVQGKLPPPEGKKFSQVWRCCKEDGSEVRVGTSLLNRLCSEFEPNKTPIDSTVYTFDMNTIAAHVVQLVKCVHPNETLMAARNIQIAMDENFLL